MLSRIGKIHRYRLEAISAHHGKRMAETMRWMVSCADESISLSRDEVIFLEDEEDLLDVEDFAEEVNYDLKEKNAKKVEDMVKIKRMTKVALIRMIIDHNYCELVRKGRIANVDKHAIGDTDQRQEDLFR